LLSVPGEIDFLHDVAVRLPLHMICTIAGLPRHDWDKMVGWADAAIEYAANDPRSDKEALVARMTDMGLYAYQLIQELRKTPNRSVFSEVVHATIPGEDGKPRALDEIELIRFFNLLISGGTETTRNAIARGMHVLLQHPDQYEALKRDVLENNSSALMENAVEEILRWTSPVHFNRRTLSTDVHFAGQHMRRGQKVTVWYPSANRDESVFDQPYTFDIYRKNANKHIAFGYGIHHCIGAALARMEIRILLEEFFRKFANYRVEAIGNLSFIRSNRHQGVARCRLRIS